MTHKEFYESLLGRSLPDPSGNPNVSIQCPLHDDTNNSFSVNLENGLWICHASCGSGNATQLVARYKNISTAEAKKLLPSDLDELPKRKRPEAPSIPDPVVAVYERALVHDRNRNEYVVKKLGWNPETIKRFNVGWNESTKRYTIPVRDETGAVRNVRMYDPDSQGTRKMISWSDGSKYQYGGARLFPVSSLEANTLILCEGEKDCILTSQYIERYAPDGWAAITGTGGAGSWSKEWNEKFAGKDVYIIYDRDEAGTENAQRIAAMLCHTAREVRVVELDITEPKGADLTNYFQDSGKGWDDLDDLISKADVFTPATKRKLKPAERDNTIHDVHLSEAGQHRFFQKRLRMRVLVAGKETQPYWVPRDVDFSCDQSMGKMCAGCSMSSQNALIEHRADKDDPSLVQMVDMDPDDQIRHLMKKLGIVSKCPRVEYEERRKLNIEEITLVPEIDFSEREVEHVTRTAFSPIHPIKPNMSYTAEGVTIPAPKRSSVVHYLPVMERALTALDTFRMDDKKGQLLRVFQPGRGQSVAQKMEEIANDLSLNITKIYGRNDLIKAIDLCYHSVVAFSFQEKPVAKAWGDVLILGDTRTGKTETVQALIYHYKAGEMSVGENTSLAGLFGGLAKGGSLSQWRLTWGKIPLNNKRLLVVDEMSGLSLETIGQMSGIRSNGIAELTKIETQRTESRTRLIWLSNPRDSKSMAEYGHGVEAINHLVGRPEDIARFDFVVTAATNEVPIEVINSENHPKVAHIYTSDLCRELVLWAWSRKIDQIHFTPEATTRTLELAVEQSRRYASVGIPLVEGGNHRIKLAKMAVAAACRTFSTKDGENVIVTEEHVEYVADFLDEIYSKPSLDYLGWSQMKLMQNQVSDEVRTEAEQFCRDHADWAEVWLADAWLRVVNFQTQFDMESKDVKADIFKPLSKLRMIQTGPNSTYHATPAFIQIIKKVQGEDPVAAAPSSSYDDEDIPF